jgi:uncharacterized membrane protein
MDTKATARVEACSDGVFAIAITLLILAIQVPDLPHGTANRALFQALRATWPSLLAFGISFATLLILWVNHHGLFHLLETVDRRALFANGLLLLLVTFVPFPTAVLARYLDQEAANVAAALYCGTYVCICLAYDIFWSTVASRRWLLRAHISPRDIHRIRHAYLIAFPLYLVATLVALLSPFAGIAMCSSLWLLWARLNYGPPEEVGNIHAHPPPRP